MKIKTMLELREEMSKLIEMMDAQIKLVEDEANIERDRIDKSPDGGLYLSTCAIRTLENGDIFVGTKASGAIRRKSMDVTNLLVNLRKGV